MTALYDVAIMLSIGLTAVLGAVFAVANTFLGRSLEQAREIASEEERNARTEAEEVVAKLRGTLDSTDSHEAIAELRKQLDQAENAERNRRIKRWFRQRFTGPHLLGVTSTVIVPGGYFVVAALTSAFAKAGMDDNIDWFVKWWMVSALSLVIGIGFLLLSLKEMERISRTTDAAYFKGQVDAFRQAMAERDEETRPTLEVLCVEDLPIQMVVGEEQTVQFRVRVRRGRPARNTEVRIFVPPGFSILDPAGETVGELQGAVYVGWERAIVMEGNLVQYGYSYLRSVTIRASETPGTYGIGYTAVYDEGVIRTWDGSLPELPVEVAAVAQ